MPESVFLNGELTDASEARIDVFDTALQHGVGLFEILRCYDKRVFCLADHIDRLNHSAATLGLIGGLECQRIEQAIGDLLETNGLTDARVRITVTGGSARVGIHLGGQAKPTTLITAGPLQPPPAEVYTDGVGVLLSEFRISETDPIGRHKTISYLPKLIALRAAQHTKLADAIAFTTGGHLAGGATGNVFLLKDDCLLTPSLELPVVPGIVRKVVIELAEELKIPVRQGKFSLKDTLAADEMFLTNSVIEILPVVAIERHLIAEGRPGPLTRILLQKYRGKARKELHLS